MKINSLCLSDNLCRLFRPNCSVAVALSGGADSVCLLHGLRVLAKEHEFSLSAVHIHHHLRGAEADRDADFCRNICDAWQIPLTVIDVDVPAEKQAGESVETAARRLRYAAFDTLPVDWVATAHNADDAMETFLINFSRGTGLRGLCGIPEHRDRYIRPLLGWSKQSILAYCKAHKLSFVEDSSNRSDAFTRNRLRHHVLPVLEQINPEFYAVSHRNFELLKQDLSFLEQVSADMLTACRCKNGLSVSKLVAAHQAISTRVLAAYCLEQTGRQPDALHIGQMQRLCLEGKGEIGLFADYRAAVRQGVFTIRSTEPMVFTTEIQHITPQNNEIWQNVHSLLFKNAIDYDKMVGKLNLRTRLPADTMRPVGRGVTKAVRRLQAEAALPKEMRDAAPIAADDLGPIWGHQIGVSERVAVDQNTKNVLIFQVYQTKNRGQ